jgi:RNA polymerase II subunit A C-terminal domain phosphatase SSU72
MGLDGADERQPPATSNGQTQKPGENPPSNASESFKLKFCTVCASNNNR